VKTRSSATAARRAVSRNLVNCCTTEGTSCTTHPQQIALVEHHVGDYIHVCASSHDALTVVGVVNKLDRRPVLLPARRYASAGTSRGSVSVSVCLSVTSRCSVETVERIELHEVLSMVASFYFSYTVLKGNLGIFKNKGTFLWNFVPNSGLISPRHIDRRTVLST